MDCWNRFGRKTLLAFTGHMDRAPGMLKELERVGMDGVDVRWQFPNPFDAVLLRHLRHAPSLGVGGYMNSMLGHYGAIKTALHLGCESALFIEDDVRFLLDTDEIARTVDALPDDFDVALFDCLAISMRDVTPQVVCAMRESRKVNDRWFRYTNMRSLGCYALSRRAMKRMTYLQSAAVSDPKRGAMRIYDHFLNRKYWAEDANLYCATTNVAVQRNMGKANSVIDFDDLYAKMGIDTSLYAK